MTPEQLKIVGTLGEVKMRQVNEESSKMLELAKSHSVKISWGTDLFGSPEKQAFQPMEFKACTRYFTPLEILRQATSINAEMFELIGLRHPYREGLLGVIEEGAYADLLIVDGNPLENIEVMTDLGKNFRVIMKDCVLYKNTLPN